MQNFSISTQIKNELDDFYTNKIVLSELNKGTIGTGQGTTRYLKGSDDGQYRFSQAETLAIVDLYYNSKFESGEKDKSGLRKIFMNVGKFRTDVSAKQVDLDTKDFKFTPEDTASPYAAFFAQKEFKEWAKDSYFGQLVNQVVESYPKYGTVVLKKVRGDIKFVPLQTLRNEQTAESLATADYVIEEHTDMTPWQIMEMGKNGDWDLTGLNFKIDDNTTIYERYGYVPKSWLKKFDEDIVVGENEEYVDAMVMMTFDPTIKKESTNKEHVFFAREIKERPYLEEHWNKQFGRWLGVGVMEDQFPNQRAKNIIVNLMRKGLHWSGKKLFQAINATGVAKNLVKNVQDGDVLEVSQGGEIKEIGLASRSNAEFQQFLNEFEKNSDQKAFTFEVATGENLPSGTPFRLGLLLTQAVNSYFGLKKEKLGLFMKKVIIKFMIPEFVKDMSKKDKQISFYSDEPGFEALKAATVELVKSEAIRSSLLSGIPVDVSTIERVIQPAEAIDKLFFNRPMSFYKDLLSTTKYDLVITGESMDIPRKVASLTTLYQVLAQQGNPMAQMVLNRIMVLVGENPSALASVKLPPPPPTPEKPQATDQAQALNQLGKENQGVETV